MRPSDRNLFATCLPVPASCLGSAGQEGPGIENFLDGANGGRGPVMQSVFWNTSMVLSGELRSEYPITFSLEPHFENQFREV